MRRGSPTQGGERPMDTTASGGKGSQGRAVSGDRPMDAAGCRPTHTEGVIPTPTPTPRHWENMKIAEGQLIGAIFGTRMFGFRTPFLSSNAKAPLEPMHGSIPDRLWPCLPIRLMHHGPSSLQRGPRLRRQELQVVALTTGRPPALGAPLWAGPGPGLAQRFVHFAVVSATGYAVFFGHGATLEVLTMPLSTRHTAGPAGHVLPATAHRLHSITAAALWCDGGLGCAGGLGDARAMLLLVGWSWQGAWQVTGLPLPFAGAPFLLAQAVTALPECALGQCEAAVAVAVDRHALYLLLKRQVDLIGAVVDLQPLALLFNTSAIPELPVLRAQVLWGFIPMDTEHRQLGWWGGRGCCVFGGNVSASGKV